MQTQESEAPKRPFKQQIHGPKGAHNTDGTPAAYGVSGALGGVLYLFYGCSVPVPRTPWLWPHL